MSKIEQIQPNYQQKLSSNRAKANYSQRQGFGKTEINLVPEGKNFYDACKKGLKTPMMSLEDFLEKNDGELQTQIITAIFTTTLAPLMIAFNPFSKKDKKDKEYLSLRQPVSALIALGCVAPATIGVNTVLSNWGCKGLFSGLDMRIAPDKFYLNPDFKKEWAKIKNNSTEREKFEKYLGIDDEVKELRASNSPVKKFLYKANVKNAYFEKIQKQTAEFFGVLVNASPNQVQIKDGKVTINTGMPREIPGIKTQEQLDKYLDKNSLHKRKFGDFMKDNFGFEFYKDGQIKPDSTLDKLKNVNAKEFLEAIGLVEDADGEALKKLLSAARQKKTVLEVQNSVPRDTEKFVASMARLGARDLQTQIGEKGIKNASMSLNQLIERLNLLNINDKLDDKSIKDFKLKKLQELMDKPIAEVMNILKTELVNNNFDKKLTDEKGIDEIAKRFMKKLASNSKNKFANVVKYTAIVSNLFITMISCTLLNWAYPRFVETFFPGLVKSKNSSDAKKGGK